MFRRRGGIRANDLERRRERKIPEKENSRDTASTETAASATITLLATYSMAAKSSLVFIIFIICYTRITSSLGLIEWSQSRCQPLYPETLKTLQLKQLLDERGMAYESDLTKPDLDKLVWITGGVMEIEMEMFSTEDGITNRSQRSAGKFETWSELQQNLVYNSPGVYLVLCSSELERRITESKRWRQFLQRLSKHGIQFVFVRCYSDDDCTSPRVLLVTIWKARGRNLWDYTVYAGPTRPGAIRDWIFNDLSLRVRKAERAQDVISEELRAQRHDENLPVALMAHLTRPLPLSYAVLASEFRSRARFFWVKHLDQHLPDRSSLLVLSQGRSVVYGQTQFLNQAELRWLLRLLMTNPDDAIQILSMFLGIVTVLVPFVADGSCWRRIKAMLWFLLLWMLLHILGVVLLMSWEGYYQKNTYALFQYLATSFAALLKPFLPDLLLLFHMISEYPILEWFPLLLYAVTVAFSERINRFFAHSVPTFVRRPFTAMFRGYYVSKASDSRQPTLPTPDSTKIAATSTKTSPDVARTTPSDVTKATVHLPSDVTRATGAEEHGGSETVHQSASNKTVTKVALSLTPEGQSSSLSAGPSPDPAMPSSSSSDCSTNRPFDYPPLLDSANGELDRRTAEQIARLNIPKIWLHPIVSDKDLKLALKKPKTVDQRIFDTAPKTKPRCFYCGADFHTTSNLRLLPCRDFFHPECVDDWMNQGNIDCPRCQLPLYATERDN